jgi:hypothetical protein
MQFFPLPSHKDAKRTCGLDLKPVCEVVAEKVV